MGASALAGLHDQGVIDQKQTRWLSGWLFCPSPVFVMVGVGQGMLGSLTTGVMLWLCCLASMLLTLRLACFAVGVCSPMTLPPGSTAGFVQGVANASGTVITLCGMVALFSGVNQVLCASPLPDVISHICAALGEVTAGCAHVIGRGGSLPAVGFVLMFGGVCTHLQCKLFLGEGMMAYPCYFAIRLVQSALCCALVGLVVTLFPQVVPTFSNSSVTSVQQQSLLPGIGLLLTCVVFLCSLQEPMGLINRKVKHDEKQGLY